MLAIVDHQDSFTYNLAQLFGEQGMCVRVLDADFRSLQTLRRPGWSAVVLSPGPGHPDAQRATLSMVRELLGRVPLLGVCLGHQVLCRALGARVHLARRPVHGERTPIRHDGNGLFRGLGPSLEVARYHSWVVEAGSLPASLRVCALDGDGQVMAVRHRRHAAYGVQFHPESFLSEGGGSMARSFLREVLPLGTEPVRRLSHG